MVERSVGFVILRSNSMGLDGRWMGWTGVGFGMGCGGFGNGTRVRAWDGVELGWVGRIHSRDGTLWGWTSGGVGFGIG